MADAYKQEAVDAPLDKTPFYVQQTVLENVVAQNASSAVRRLKALIKSPENWGMRVFDVKRLLEHVSDDLHRYAEYHSVSSDFKHICRKKPCPFQDDHRGVEMAAPDTSAAGHMAPNMHLLVSRYVRPWTKMAGMGFAGAMNASFLARFQGAPEELCQTRVFISHCWNESFPDFVTTLTNMLAMHEVVWICALAIDQNANVKEMLGDRGIHESPFAQALRSAEKCLVLMDERAEPPQRVWCVYEAHLALQHGLSYSMALADNTNQSMWKRVRSVLQGLDVRDCKASDEDDKRRILEAIDADSVNNGVLAASTHAADAAEVMSAAASGAERMLKDFCASGRTLDVRDARGRTPLHVAAECGQDQLIPFLVAHFTEEGQKELLTHRTSDGLLPLHFAALKGHGTCVKTLLQAMPELTPLEVDNEGETALHLACIAGTDAAVSALLESTDSDYIRTKLDHSGRNAMHRAAGGGHASTVQILLSRCCESLEAKSASGDGPLHLAAQRCQSEVVKVLISSRADVHALADGNSSVLHRAAFGGSDAVIKELIAAGAVVNGREQEDWTPLHRAAFNGHEAATKTLLESRADVEAVTGIEGAQQQLTGVQHNWPPRVPMAMSKQPLRAGGCARKLAMSSIPAPPQHRANLMRVQPSKQENKRPIRIASTPCLPGGYMDLGRAGYESDDTDDEDAVLGSGAWTALHVAAITGHGAVAALLVEHRANLQRRSAEKETPMDAARRCGHLDLAAALASKADALSILDLLAVHKIHKVETTDTESQSLPSGQGDDQRRTRKTSACCTLM